MQLATGGRRQGVCEMRARPSTQRRNRRRSRRYSDTVYGNNPAVGHNGFCSRRGAVLCTPRIGPVSEIGNRTAFGAQNSRIIQAIVLADRLRLSAGIYTGLQTERHRRGQRCDWQF